MGQGQSNSTVQGEFFGLFTKKFFKKFEEYGHLISCFDDKNFNERQSYGLVVASLMDMGKDINNKGKVVDFVLTEVGMVRNGGVEGKKSSGRVDYLIGFGGWLFLIELKLKFVGLKIPSKKSEKCAPWNGDNGVVTQLETINSSDDIVLNKIIESKQPEYNGVIEFPMLMVVYANYNKLTSPDKAKEHKSETKVNKRHDSVAEQLDCIFKECHILKNPIRREHTNKKGGKQWRTTYGVGIMAGSNKFQ